MLLKSRTSLTCFRACVLPGRAKDLSAPRVHKPLYVRRALSCRLACTLVTKVLISVCEIHWNACYHSVQKLLSSRLLSKNLKIKIYRTIILPVVLYGCESWLLILREERRLRVFENGVLRRIFGPKRDEVTGEWRNYIMRS